MFEKILSPKKILIIEPPFYTLFGYKRYHYPFSSVLVGTYLEGLGHKVIVYDGDRPTPECREYNRKEAGDNYYRYEEALRDSNHPVWNKLRTAIIDYQPEIVCITASISAKEESAALTAKITKKICGDNVLTVLGGVHVSSMLSMNKNYNFGKYYDKLCTYIPDFIKRKPNKKLIMNYDKYEPKDFCSIWASSGCPNSCTFCCYSKDRKVSFRPIETIKEELIEIKKDYGTLNPIYFIDDSFISYTKRFYEITNLSNELGFKFRAGGRIMDLSPEKIDKFIQNRGERIYLGIESGSQKILDLIKKKLKIEEIIRRTKWLNKTGIPWSAFFIAGFPFETIEDLKMTKELIQKIKPTFVSLNRFVPYPGTQIYKDYYMDANLQFKDLFQLNRNICLNLDDKLNEYIEDLFVFVDQYNETNK